MKTTVVASGYFNPLHYGHVSYLQKARDIGSSLLVIVNNDKQAALRSGNYGMPARDRVRLVRSLACVDLAIEAVDEDDSVADTLRLLHPDVFANGGNKMATRKEAAVCAELGIKMVNGLGIEVLLLEGFTQHYEWGKPRGSSAVAALAGQDQRLSPGKKGKPFAELWMGDHPSGPSNVRTPEGTSSGCLISTLQRSPAVLGEVIAKEGSLPFLMKVLSIEKALSIQAHPDRVLATQLHKERPEVYKDPNHKPEIAIALTDFEALCGFRTLTELVEMVDAVPELASIIGTEAVKGLHDAVQGGFSDKEPEALKAAYSSMMRSTDDAVKSEVLALVERARAAIKSEGLSKLLTKVFQLVLRLYDQFQVDIGIFSVFFLNYVEMKVGDCLYMPQNTPHAYLSGDIVECMACSDNVVRGGLTPKFKDIEVLCDMLDYSGGRNYAITPQNVEPGMVLYADDDIEEFQVTHLTVPKGEQRRICFSVQGPALGFAWGGTGTLKISGEKTNLRPGIVFLLSAGVDTDFDAQEDLDCFIACCPSAYFKKQGKQGSPRADPRGSPRA